MIRKIHVFIYIRPVSTVSNAAQTQNQLSKYHPESMVIIFKLQIDDLQID